MVKSMFLGLVSIAATSAVGGVAMAQAKLAVSTDVVQSSAAAPLMAGAWTACVNDYIRRHAAQIQDPDSAADDAFVACRSLQVASRAASVQPAVYVGDDEGRQGGKYSLLTQKVGFGGDSR